MRESYRQSTFVTLRLQNHGTRRVLITLFTYLVPVRILLKEFCFVV